MRKWAFYCSLALLTLFGCRKGFDGETLENQAPETFTTADTINRTGDNRFRSVVNISWWGNDPDGFISSYEISFDGHSWSKTNKQDSTFILDLPNDSDTADFSFYVRAIDNLGLADPTPAMVVYPVKNSPPQVQFIISDRTPNRTFPAVKYFWQGSDPDGNNTLDYYELVWNDTTLAPLKLSAGFNEAAFVADDLNANNSTSTVFPGTLNNALPDKCLGMKLNEVNLLYVRAVDRVGAKSEWVFTPEVFIKKPVSDILFINAQRAAFNRNTVQQYYTQKFFNTLQKSFDTLQAGPSNAVLSELSADPQTQDRVFTLFKKIFVYSEDSEFILSLLQRSTNRYFQNGGKMMLISEGNDVLANEPTYLDFTPISRYAERPPRVSLLFNTTDSLYSSNSLNPSLLNGTSILTGIRPFIIPENNNTFSYQALYSASITQDSAGRISPWRGPSTLVAKRNRNGQTDFIVCMVPIVRLRQTTAIDNWFRRMLIDELAY